MVTDLHLEVRDLQLKIIDLLIGSETANCMQDSPIGGERPLIGGKRPQILGDKALIEGERPQIRGVRPPTEGERPLIRGKTSDWR